MGSSGDHYVNIWISGQQATFLGQKWSGIRIDTEIIGKLLGYHIKRQLSWFMAQDGTRKYLRTTRTTFFHPYIIPHITQRHFNVSARRLHMGHHESGILESEVIWVSCYLLDWYDHISVCTSAYVQMHGYMLMLHTLLLSSGLTVRGKRIYKIILMKRCPPMAKPLQDSSSNRTF